VTGLSPGATYTITPSTIPAGAVATNVTLNITLPQSTAQLQHGGGGLLHVALGLLLLPLFRRVRGKGRSLLLLLVVAVGALVPLTGCGTNSGFFGHQPQSYTITLTAKSGTLSHSTTVILNVP